MRCSRIIVHGIDETSLRTHNALLEGAIYKAEIYAILLLLWCPIQRHPFWLKSKFSDSGQKPWTIVRCFDQISLRTHNSSLEGVMRLKFTPFCSYSGALSNGILFG